MNINKILRIDQLIENQSTGTPDELARKVELSERAVYNYLKFMKEELNAPIVYSKAGGTYKYNSHGRFYLKWKEE